MIAHTILGLGFVVVVLWFGACWVAYKEKRLLFWLAWSIVGYPLSLVLIPFFGIGFVLLVVWYVGLVVLPLWWLLRPLVRGDHTPAPPQPASLDDFKPLVDKDGRQIFP